MRMKPFNVLLAVVLLFSVVAPNLTLASSQNFNKGQQVALNKQLQAIAKKTYRFFEDHTHPETGLTDDRIDLNRGQVTAYAHTSPTNIGMYLLSTISAVEMGFISTEEGRDKVKTTLETLNEMETWNGLYYNWYYTNDGSVMEDWGLFISTVDNGWLTAALVAVGQAFPELQDMTDPLVEQMDYSTLYDLEVGQMRGGYDAVKGELTEHHYGMFYTEPRVASYVAIGKGDVPAEHWWRMYRTLPPEWDWQNQVPQGYYEEYDGVNVFQGHYEYLGSKFVPSWGGSMFEGLMPSLVLKENELGTSGLGLNNKRYAELQLKFAEEKGYQAWGFSPAATPDGYSEFGVFDLGTSGYEDQATVTPHATFLALDHIPAEAYQNIKVLRSLGMYGKYGFYDSVNLETGEIANTYLALDQGMIIVSIANYLYDGIVREYFHSDPIGKEPEHLLIRESFSISQ